MRANGYRGPLYLSPTTLGLSKCLRLFRSSRTNSGSCLVFLQSKPSPNTFSRTFNEYFLNCQSLLPSVVPQKTLYCSYKTEPRTAHGYSQGRDSNSRRIWMITGREHVKRARFEMRVKHEVEFAKSQVPLMFLGSFSCTIDVGSTAVKPWTLGVLQFQVRTERRTNFAIEFQ